MRRTTMIKYSEIHDVFIENEIDAIEYNYESNEEIDTPFVVYVATDGASFGADGINYLNLVNIRLALTDVFINTETMRLVEKTLDENFIRYDKNIDFDNDSRLYSIQYSFNVLDG